MACIIRRVVSPRFLPAHGIRHCQSVISKLSLRELREFARNHLIDLSDCFEKSEIVEKIQNSSLDFSKKPGEKKEQQKQQRQERAVEEVDSGDFRTDLFGPQLTRIQFGKLETVSTHKALQDVEVVAVMFGKFDDPLSFQLIPHIQKVMMQRSLPKQRAIVFATRDTDQKNFEKMFNHMPWWSIPFKNRYLVEKLASRFHIIDNTALAIVHLNWKEHRIYSAKGAHGDNSMYNAISDFIFTD